MRWILLLLPSTAVVLCMTFPFTLFPGQLYDLRLVVILLSILYGGIGPGLAVTTTSFVYRYVIGGSGFLQMLLTFTPILVLAFYINPRFVRYSKAKKVVVAALLNAAPVVLNIMVVILRYPIEPKHLWFLCEWGIVEVATTVMVVFLIDTVRSNVEMRHHLQELEKVQLVNSLTASIAHEIRNPLTVSRGFLQLLQENNSEQTRRDYLNIVLGELDKASSVIDEYLSLSHPQLNNMERVNVSQLIQQSLASITPYATLHNVSVIQNLETDVYMSIDGERFSKCVLNIMKNGIEAMPKGGTLSVQIRRRRRAVGITVSDTGIGMTSEQIQRLGKPFYSTKHKGTGLGLMTSYRFIQLMKGQIQVTSKVNAGTTFSVSLPVSDTQPSVVESAAELENATHPTADLASENWN
ncbi:hypothetical protein GI364_17595 [Alicyclobacillus sp. SO9]|nr:ATP-binding protein [Alicyclobacillus sp. SO9]QQE77730.1 hypothetical protein GI364_17595 [Alicyclobacillus sp. SO9]